MPKTWDDYYNDPRIINEFSAMREIHAIRLMNADIRKNMTETEYNALVIKNTEPFMTEYKKHSGIK